MKYEFSLCSATKVILLLAGFWVLYQVRSIVLKVKPMGEQNAVETSWPLARKVHFEIIFE